MNNGVETSPIVTPDPQSRIIIPLDVPDLAAAIALVDRLPEAQFFKVGLELFVAEGPAVVQMLRSRQKRIFLDLKFHDIPNTMAGACRSAARYGVDLLTVHATAGAAALVAAQQAAIAGATAAGVSPPNLIAVTVLTSISAPVLARELGVAAPLETHVQTLAQLTQTSGLSGIVCSPQELAAVRSACPGEFLLVCPGVRPDWADRGDQARTMTPRQALEAGATYLVIGRPITQATDPAAAFAKVCAELEAAA
jgi:orotidine-5'-phosphate decarboxylase